MQANLGAGILDQSQADALLGLGNILLVSVTRRWALIEFRAEYRFWVS